MRRPGWGGEDSWHLSISGAVLARFNLDAYSMDLINADYIIGFPIFGEYYLGNLPFGQFYKLRVDYYGIGINVSF